MNALSNVTSDVKSWQTSAYPLVIFNLFICNTYSLMCKWCDRKDVHRNKVYALILFIVSHVSS